MSNIAAAHRWTNGSAKREHSTAAQSFQLQFSYSIAPYLYAHSHATTLSFSLRT